MISKIGNLNDYKILVIGAAGFLGRRLVQVLLEKRAFVVGIDYCNRLAKPINDFAGHESFRYISGSFLEKSDEALSSYMPDKRKKIALFHMAGLAHVRECEENPSKAFKSNVILTHHALEFCRMNEIRRFIFPSTGLVYGDHLGRPATEEDPTISKNLYLATKLSSEALIQGYAKSFGISCMIVRLGNVYGPGSNPDTVVGALVRQAINNQQIIARDLRSVRDFIYIDDVIEGFLYLLVSMDNSGCSIINLSTGIGTSVQNLAETVCKVASIQTRRIQSQKTSNSPISSLVLSNTLLAKRTGWKPKYNLPEGLSLILK